MGRTEHELLTVAGRDVPISNPHKVLFPEAGHTKLDLARYYLAVADGALRGAGNRPNVLVRYPNGIHGEFFFQKRAPESRPPWIDVASLKFPSGRSAEEVVPRDASALVWMAVLTYLELHPHPVRADDLDHPDELRVDLDPVPGVDWPQIREVCGVVRATLDDLGLVGWPKTSGSRGMHIYIRIAPQWPFEDVRRAALALAREVERRAPSLATSKWWKEERHGVFLDYNQNAKDRTIAGAYSVRPRADARVSAPLTWEEIADADPADFTLRTMPTRYAAAGDPHAAMDRHVCSLESLLELAARQLAEGLGDAPWPPALPQAERRAATRRPVAPAQPGEAGERCKTREPREPPRTRRPPPAVRQQSAAAVDRLTIWSRSDALAIRTLRLRGWNDGSCVTPTWRDLEAADVLVDAMRGRFRTWTRIRVNLQHVPENIRPPQEPLDPNEDLDDWNVSDRKRPAPNTFASSVRSRDLELIDSGSPAGVCPVRHRRN